MAISFFHIGITIPVAVTKTDKIQFEFAFQREQRKKHTAISSKKYQMLCELRLYCSIQEGLIRSYVKKMFLQNVQYKPIGMSMN